MLPKLLHDNTKYLCLSDRMEIEKAFELASELHEGQFRESGEPYLNHCYGVALLLSDLRLDKSSIVAGLLHDAIEDCENGREEMQKFFSKEIIDIVSGVTKISMSKSVPKHIRQNENFMNIIMSMSRDPRTIIVKLADRLHNMRTLGAMKHAARIRIAKETLELYAPIAGRIGLHDMRNELEDHCFRWLHPTRYFVLSKEITKATISEEGILEHTQACLSSRRIASEKLSFREKSPASIYRKMRRQHKRFAEILDIAGVRVIVRDEDDCYRALGAIHSMNRPLPGTFKDYIASPKENGYQSLHTSVLTPKGVIVEYQIRTASMHADAERGVASHWKYKEYKPFDQVVVDRVQNGLRDLLDIHRNARDAGEFISAAKLDLHAEEVRVFTPKGEIITLPEGSTAIDFAYAISREIGDHAKSFTINGVERGFAQKVYDGDTIKVETGEGFISEEAMDAAVSGRARSGIRNLLRGELSEHAVSAGKKKVMQLLADRGISFNKKQMDKTDRMLMGVFASVGARDLSPISGSDAATSLLFGRTDGITRISGNEHGLVLCKTCRPLPGDDIEGDEHDGNFVIHRRGCCGEGEGRRRCSWWGTPLLEIPVMVKVEVRDAPGVLPWIAGFLDDLDFDMDDIKFIGKRGSVSVLSITSKVRSRRHLVSLTEALGSLPFIRRINLV